MPREDSTPREPSPEGTPNLAAEVAAALHGLSLDGQAEVLRLFQLRIEADRSSTPPSEERRPTPYPLDLWGFIDRMGHPCEPGWMQSLVSPAAEAIAHYLGMDADHWNGGHEPSDDVLTATSEAFYAGAIIGFCLGQTYPATPQELGRWPAEAIRRGNLEQWAKDCRSQEE